MRATKLFLIASLSLLWSAHVRGASDASLTCAEDLAKQYKDYSYGTGAAKIDCVNFVLKVVECRLGQPIEGETRKAILIAHGWSAQEMQAKAQEGTDAKLAGVQYALTQVLKKGKVVAADDAKPGDLIQYWMKRADGTWFGHAGVITRVNGHMATILGAHASLNKVGELPEPVNLAGANRLIFLVRIER